MRRPRLAIVALVIAAIGGGGYWWWLQRQIEKAMATEYAAAVKTGEDCLERVSTRPPICDAAIDLLAKVMTAFEQIEPPDRKTLIGGYNLIARIERARDRPKAAIAAYQKVAHYEPQRAYNYGHLAELYVKTGQLGMALRTADLAVQLDPAEWRAHRMQARVLVATGDRMAALAAYAAALRAAPPESRGELREERAALEREVAASGAAVP